MFYGCVLALFLILNLGILYEDLTDKKIRNRYLIMLGILLPFWIYTHQESYSQLESISLLPIYSILTLGIGILAYDKKGFIGAGDVKYASILYLYLGGYTVQAFIMNISMLTFLLLVFLLGIATGGIYYFRSLGTWENLKSKLYKSEGGKYSSILVIGGMVFDWVIIGYILGQITRGLYEYVGLYGHTSSNIFFLLGISIFLLRNWIRSTFFSGERLPFSIFGILLLYLHQIKEFGWTRFFSEYIYFLKNIWIYALSFLALKYITQLVFELYETLVPQDRQQGVIEQYNTIPYSIIIFGGFIFTVFFDTNIFLFFISGF